MDLQTNKRLIGLDLIKVVACFLVVALHTCYTKDTNVTISSVLYYSGVIAIPLFFITNGYLLFGKTRKNEWYSYKKIGRILLLTFLLNGIICILYAIIKHSFRNPFSETISNLFFQKGFLSHFWFMGTLILIYLMFPAFDYLYQYKQKYFFLLSACFICIQCLVDFLNIYSSIKCSNLLQSHISQTFRIESHFSYFILGGVLKLLKTKVIKYASLRNVLFLYGLAIIYQFFMIKSVYPTFFCEYFYDNLIIICLSGMVFLYLSEIQIINGKEGIIYIISNLIMLIYIVHPFVIRFYNKIINIRFNIVELIVVFSISALLSWIISKMPYAKVIFKI
jgi:surface polysaccharide O-acyltransferase-like enzyme